MRLSSVVVALSLTSLLNQNEIVAAFVVVPQSTTTTTDPSSRSRRWFAARSIMDGGGNNEVDSLQDAFRGISSDLPAVVTIQLDSVVDEGTSPRPRMEILEALPPMVEKKKDESLTTEQSEKLMTEASKPSDSTTTLSVHESSKTIPETQQPTASVAPKEVVQTSIPSTAEEESSKSVLASVGDNTKDLSSKSSRISKDVGTTSVTHPEKTANDISTHGKSDSQLVSSVVEKTEEKVSKVVDPVTTPLPSDHETTTKKLVIGNTEPTVSGNRPTPPPGDNIQETKTPQILAKDDKVTSDEDPIKISLQSEHETMPPTTTTTVKVDTSTTKVVGSDPPPMDNTDQTISAKVLAKDSKVTSDEHPVMTSTPHSDHETTTVTELSSSSTTKAVESHLPSSLPPQPPATEDTQTISPKVLAKDNIVSDDRTSKLIPDPPSMTQTEGGGGSSMTSHDLPSLNEKIFHDSTSNTVELPKVLGKLSSSTMDSDIVTNGVGGGGGIDGSESTTTLQQGLVDAVSALGMKLSEEWIPNAQQSISTFKAEILPDATKSVLQSSVTMLDMMERTLKEILDSM